MDLRLKCEIHTNINTISHFIRNVKRILTMAEWRERECRARKKLDAKIFAPRRKSNLLFQNYHERNNNFRIESVFVCVRLCKYVNVILNSMATKRWERAKMFNFSEIRLNCWTALSYLYLSLFVCIICMYNVLWRRALDACTHIWLFHFVIAGATISCALHYLTILSDYADAVDAFGFSILHEMAQ